MHNLPYGVVQNILLYLSFEQVFLIDNHIANKLYNPKKYKNCSNRKIANFGIKFIKWLGKNNKELPFRLSAFIHHAASFGRLDILKCLYENISLAKAYILDERCDGCIDEKTPMDNAARFGYLDTVKWFHSIGAKCTTWAIDAAAYRGHLNVIKWLHKNRIEGCTIKASRLAAENGHLNIVRWLHKNKTELFNTGAMDKAATNGRLEVVKWLHKNRTEGCTTLAMDWAVLNGHLEVVKWLRENYEMFR